nr:oligosaccharide flippase family protein [uncultured Chryseobacterium sp.]
MVPIYFKFMSVSTYGAWLATGNVVAMIGLVESGFSGVITQKMSVALAKEDFEKFKELAGANIYTALFMSIIVLIFGLSIYPFVASWINADLSIRSSITEAYIISLFSAVISLLVSLFGAFPQVWQKTKTVGIINTVVNLISIGSLIIYLNLGFGVVSLALGYATRSLLNLIGQGIWIMQQWRKRELKIPVFKIQVAKDIVKDCFYPFLSKISNVLMTNSQSFIIALFVNTTAATIFDITGKIATVGCSFVSMANGSFFALFSLTFAKRNTKDINKLFRNVSSVFLNILLSALLYAAVFSESIIHFWVGQEKFGGNTLLGLIIVSLLVIQLRQYFNNVLYSGGLMSKSAKLDIYSVLLFLVVLLLIIKSLGLYAIPIASIISGLVFGGLYLVFLKKELNVEIQIILKQFSKIFITVIVFLFIHFLLKINLLDIHNLIKYIFLFTCFYLIVLGFTNLNFLSRFKYGKK